MATQEYEYVLEISDMTGDGLGEEPHTLIESGSPIPIPNVGDRVSLPGVMAEVKKREFSVYGEDPIAIKVQVFCKEVAQKKTKIGAF